MRIIQGDLLNCESNHIAHVANCQCVFGAGIARQIREQYPEAYEADLETKKGDRNKLGTFSSANILDENKFIYNLYGQYGYGGGSVNLDYLALEKSLWSLRDHLEGKQCNDIILGFPLLMGCGLAGGDFKIVQPMVEKMFETSGFETIWVKYKSIPKIYES